MCDGKHKLAQHFNPFQSVVIRVNPIVINFFSHLPALKPLTFLRFLLGVVQKVSLFPSNLSHLLHVHT